MNRTLLLSAGAFVLASALLERIGITKDISAAIFLCIWFAYIFFRVRRRDMLFDIRDALLIIPIVVICLLVVLKQVGAISVSSTLIWVGGGLLFILAGALRFSTSDLRLVGCRAFEGEPTEFLCHFQAREPAGDWRKRSAIVAVQRDGWVLLSLD